MYENIKKYTRDQVFIFKTLFSLVRLCILIIILYILIAITGNLLSAPQYDFSPRYTQKSENAAKQNLIKPLSSYMTVLNQNSLFGSQKQAPDPEPVKTNDKSLEMLLQEYEIQGVIWGDVPKAIILDKRNKETITAGINDSIGQIEIISINDGSITFQLLGDTHEIKY
jgi:hypothetical protein